MAENEKPGKAEDQLMTISRDTFQMMIQSQNLALMEYSKLTAELAEIRSLLYQRLATPQAVSQPVGMRPAPAAPQNPQAGPPRQPQADRREDSSGVTHRAGPRLQFALAVWGPLL